MTSPHTLRLLTAALLAAVIGLTVGCGGPPAKLDAKKDEAKKGDILPPKPDDIPTPKPPDTPPKTTLGAVEKAADDAATAFRRDLVTGVAKADALSATFLKAVGKPAQLPSDKARGYSTDTAASWLRKVGETVNFGPEMKREQAGDVAYLRGALQKPGTYSLRLVKEGGAWKVDWLSISSVENGTVTTTPTPEGAALGFAVAAFVELTADVSGMPAEERAVALGAALTPALRTAWASPFDQDKNAGLDFNPAALVRKATAEIGGGTSAYTATRVGDLPEFTVELTKPAGKKKYTVKLVKGAAPHEWLVSEVAEAKG